MADELRTGPDPQGDRRKDDRRRQDRRQPPPVWRRPWALVAYGVVGTLLVVLLLNRSRPAPTPAGGDEVVTTAPAGAPISQAPPPGRAGVPEEARRMADYERIMAAGEAAKGRRLRVELYCSSITHVALRSVDVVESAVAELAEGGNRVPAAECKWGPGGESQARADFLLLVPSDLAEAFAAAPVVDDSFVQRRRVVGVVEWVGRSEALALRTVGVLREYPGTQEV